MKLKGKKTVITGGASGMGKAAACLFAKEGASVAILDINGEEGKKADNDDEEDLDEVHRPVYKADEVQLVNPKPEYVHGVNENKEFDLDSLLKEINKLEDLKPISETIDVKRKPIKRPKLFSNKPPSKRFKLN